MVADTNKILVLDRNFPQAKMLRTLDCDAPVLNFVEIFKNRFFFLGGEQGFTVKFDFKEDFREVKSATAAGKSAINLINCKVSRKYGAEQEYSLTSGGQIVSDVNYDQWLIINENRKSFRLNVNKDNVRNPEVQVVFHNLPSQEIKAICAHPFYWHDRNQYMAVMDNQDVVSVVKATINEDAVNEGLKIAKYERGVLLMDSYGSQQQPDDMTLVALNTRKSTLWLRKMTKSFFATLDIS